MESLALSNVSVLANTVSINAVAATKVAGVRMAKPTRALHTPAMKTTFKASKKAAVPVMQAKTYATAPVITNDAAAKSEIDVEGWIKKHYTPYEGDGSFLAGPTEKTKKLFAKAEEYLAKERANGGLYDVDPHTPSTITSHKPGYLDKENEVIYGYQTDVPLKRAIKPFGGVNMVKNALKAVNVPMDKEVEHIFTDYRKTHNTAVFDIYSKEMRAGRSNAIMTGLPDGYGRGRIIGDYRRVALYGTDRLIAQKEKDKAELQKKQMDEPTMKLIGEVADQVKALKQLTQMAKSYGIDISKPAKNAREATQFVYFGYLGSIKEQDGAAMSLGRVDAFLDCFFENDLKNGVITESEAQEIVDNLILKLRFARHLRTPEYNDLFAGDPTWVTMSLGGMGSDGRTLVTKTSFRVLNTLYNLGPAPEPNITVLWNKNLPKNFKDFATKVSIDTSSIQYESDALMSARFGDDYGIACCVSAMRIGKDMQFFGARCNLAKLMLYVLNHGKDERTGKQVGPDFGPVPEGPIPFDWMWETYDKAMDWIAKLYVNTMNVIHFCHDQYCYESLQMALHDTDVRRLMAFGVAGLSVVADSFSAIKYAKVTPIRDPKTGLTVDFKVEGEFPKFGNDDDRVDFFARTVTDKLINKLRKTPTYRGATHTLSILTITSNVVYGKKTGSTPDGRKAGQPFAPGCNPMHGREFSGAVASLSSVAKVNYDSCMDGISNTFSIVPNTIGKTLQERQGNLSGLLDGYFTKGAHHLNVNVLKRETLEDAMAHPENYPNLTIRVSGYAVNFVKLTPAQQKEVIARTFHEKILKSNKANKDRIVKVNKNCVVEIKLSIIKLFAWKRLVIDNILMYFQIITQFFVTCTTKQRQLVDNILNKVQLRQLVSNKRNTINFGEQRHLNELLFKGSSESPVPKIVGLAEFLTNAIPIISSSFELLFDRYCKISNLTKSVDVVLIRHNENTGLSSITTKGDSCPSSSINDESGESLVDTTLSILRMLLLNFISFLFDRKVDPQYWCKIVVKLYFVLINNIMRNGNVIGKIFLLHPRISNTFLFAKSNYFSIIQQTTNYRNYLLQKDIKLLQFSLYSRLYN
ncbi:hypothetical protein H8356DRAFT_1435038 [Neocallimastix lanati (nom. inval.)]|nr:hypothetical protein H8356DRAFT_1435038 [Neocallimastix sp. JGI-2020a]